MQASPFVVFDKQGVIGALKAIGSRDPDVLYAARGKLRAVAAVPRVVGVGLMVVAALLVVKGQSAAVVGLIAAVGGWFLFRGNRNVKMVDAGYQEYAARLSDQGGSST